MATFSASLGKVTASQKLLLGLLLLVGSAAVFYFLFYSPKVDQFKSKDDEKASAESQLQRALADYRAWEQLSQDLEKARQHLEELNQILPTTRDVEGLMTRINAQAKDAQLRLTNIVPEEEQEDESGMYIRIPIKIEFRGTFHEVLHFFNLIDISIQRLVNMENIQLEEKGGDDEQGVLTGSVLATTFMAKEKESAEGDQAKSK
jgi:type IV pilus assembly protein PilO